MGRIEVMCGAQHPDLPVTCNLREGADSHEEHIGFFEGLVEWPNADYKPRVRQSLGTSASKTEKMKEIISRVDAERTTAQATTEAIERVDVAADEQWKDRALEVVRACAERHPEFTADEVWEILEGEGVSTHEPAALGPVFLRAKKHGWIENTGRRRERSIYSRRHRELTIWRSLLRSGVPQEIRT